MRERRKIFNLVAALMVSLSSVAQVYQCDFENQLDRNAWHLNAGVKGPTCANQWGIDAPGQFGRAGSHGLYIHPAGVDTVATYVANNSMFVASYVDVTLNATGQHTLSFDYKCQGGADAYAVVCWVPQTQNVASNDANNNLPSWTTTAQLAKLYDEPLWSSKTCTFNATTTAGRIAIFWVNAQGNPHPTSACLDNFTIYEGTPCATAPTGLQYTNNRAQWNAAPGAAYYEGCVYNTFDNTITSIDSIGNTTSWHPNFVGSGFMYVYVRSVCADGSHSAWARVGQFVYDNSDMCIDYLDLGDNARHAGICYHGSTSNPKQTTGKVDFGFASDRSLHTVHYMRDETDPNTDGLLHTVPDDAIASVRLGGYYDNSSNVGSCIEYKMTVEKGASDLLVLKYAAVLNYADFHSKSDEARFKLDVLDQRGQPLSACTSGDFSAGFGTGDVWHWSTATCPSSDERYQWCDWQTITVSLVNYIGQTITIRLQSFSCTATIHPGYAYFTIGCESGQMQGIACGDFSTDHFEAPEGFNYRWYWTGDPEETLGTEQNFHIEPTDTNIYAVDLTQKFGNNCGYTLVANPNPKFPRAVVSKRDSSQTDCRNLYRFNNSSKVFIINRVTRDTMPNISGETLDYLYWDWGDGSPLEDKQDALVSHEFPAKGGTYHVKAYASMNKGICQDSMELVVNVPNLLASAGDTTIYRQTNHPYVARSGKTYNSQVDTVFIDTAYVRNSYGCEAPYETTIVYSEGVRVDIDTMICEGDVYVFEGKEYRTTSRDTARFHIMPQDYDSVRYLNLYVVPRLTVNVPPVVDVCGREDSVFIPLTITRGADQYDGAEVDYHFLYADGTEIAPATYVEHNHTVALPMPEYVLPNYYLVRVIVRVKADEKVKDSTFVCGTDELETTVLVRYDASILDQKTNYIALLNEHYNYLNLTYDSVYWFRGDSLLADEHGTYIHATEADINQQYYVALVRHGEKVAVPSCPITYVGHPVNRPLVPTDGSQTAVYPRTMGRHMPIHVTGAESITVMDMMGRLLTMRRSDGDTTIPAPDKEGVYLVVLDNHLSYRILVY